MPIMYQFWGCVRCGGERIWGASVVTPSAQRARPWLFCDMCDRVAQHKFVRNEERVVGASLS
jgi:hypothetical protein